MANIIKAQIAPVSIGHLTIEGLFGDDGKFYIAVPQISAQFQLDNNQASRKFKALIGGNDFQFPKVQTPLNPKPVNAILYPSQEWTKVVFELATEGNAKAQELIGVKSNNKNRSCKLSSNLYVMRTEDNLYIKIGVSNNPEKRLKSIQTGCPSKVELVFSKKVLNARTMEEEIHQRLKDYNTNGEWFDAAAYSIVDWDAI